MKSRRFLQDTPIRRKLTLMLLLTSGAVLALTCGLFFTYEFLTFRRTTVAQLATLGEVVASNSAAALAFRSAEDAEQILSALKANPHIVEAGLYAEDGTLFARYPAGVADNRLPVRPQVDGHRYGRDGLDSFQAVTREGKRLGTLYLHSDLGAIYTRLRLYTGMMAVVIAAAFGLAYVVSRSLQRQISQPILALESIARAVSDRGDYSVRATKAGDDEVGRLTDAFNHMLDELQRMNRELEQRVLDRTAELEAANQELEAFSYSVSHDLRAPLRHIGGFAAMLERHKGSTFDDTGRRYVGIIKDSTQRMGRLIDDLLLFSRNGRTELRREPIRLDDLVGEVRQSLQGEVTGRVVVWQVEPLPVVMGDLGLLRQVFANLLSNAVKYTRQRPEARIDIGVGHAPGPGETVVFVRDNGAGFDMKHVDKLFGVFQRLHTEEAFEGNGVGLATVRRIVLRHGGRAWAEARVDHGATFFIALPLLNHANPPAATAPGIKPS